MTIASIIAFRDLVSSKLWMEPAKSMVLLMLFAGGLLLSPGVASGTVFEILGPQIDGPKFGVDDWNISTLNPFPPIEVSSLSGGQCPWINTGLNAFIDKNPGWSYVWASQADEAKVEQGITILNYFAYVVTQPDVTAADGKTYKSDRPGTYDLGGAVFNIKYTPVAGAPPITRLHWIQAYDEVTKGVAATRLDNPDADFPWYDGEGTAGTLAGGGGWFLDTPFTEENEYELNPVANIQFQVALADYDGSNKKLTLYGGEGWGYVYTAYDVLPEPPSLLLFCVSGLTMLRVGGLQWRKWRS